MDERELEDYVLNRIDNERFVDKLFDDNSPLTPIERAVAYLTMEGFTPKEITRHFEYSDHRVYQIIDKIQRKVGKED